MSQSQSRYCLRNAPAGAEADRCFVGSWCGLLLSTVVSTLIFRKSGDRPLEGALLSLNTAGAVRDRPLSLRFLFRRWRASRERPPPFCLCPPDLEDERLLLDDDPRELREFDLLRELERDREPFLVRAAALLGVFPGDCD